MRSKTRCGERVGPAIGIAKPVFAEDMSLLLLPSQRRRLKHSRTTNPSAKPRVKH